MSLNNDDERPNSINVHANFFSLPYTPAQEDDSRGEVEGSTKTPYLLASHAYRTRKCSGGVLFFVRAQNSVKYYVESSAWQ